MIVLKLKYKLLKWLLSDKRTVHPILINRIVTEYIVPPVAPFDWDSQEKRKKSPYWQYMCLVEEAYAIEYFSEKRNKELLAQIIELNKQISTLKRNKDKE